MRVDTYTKVVLTVIAACLVWMCVGASVPVPVSADAPQEVILVGVRGDAGSLAVRPTQDWYRLSLPVDAPRPVGVQLLSIDRAAGRRWDAMDVNIKEQPRKGMPGN